MTRRQLAKRLSEDLRRRGVHYVQGTTVYKTTEGDWGVFPGLERPPENSAWYEFCGWDVVHDRNTVLKVETNLRDLERKFEGHAKRVDRKSLKVH